VELNPEDIAVLLGEAPKSLRDRVEAKVKESLDILASKGYPARAPKVKYDLKGRTAGQAVGGHTIRVNLQILSNPKHTEDMLNSTIPHEVAHIVVMQTWPSASGHGSEWRRMMFYLGLEAERCHNYETVAARKRDKPYTYYCMCDTPHKVSITLHRRIMQGRRYRCRKCGSYLRGE